VCRLSVGRNPEVYSNGMIRYQPSSSDSAEGRLLPQSRASIQLAYDDEHFRYVNVVQNSLILKYVLLLILWISSCLPSGSDPKAALRLAQKLVVSSAEFHSTNVVVNTGEARADAEVPVPSKKVYKDIVLMDGFNMLIPLDGCINSTGDTVEMFKQYQDARGDLARPLSVLQTIDTSHPIKCAALSDFITH